MRYIRLYLKGSKAGIRLLLVCLLLFVLGFIIRPLKPYRNLETVKKDIESWNIFKRILNKTLDSRDAFYKVSDTVRKKFDEAGLDESIRQMENSWSDKPVSIHWNPINGSKPVFSVNASVKGFTPESKILESTIYSSFKDPKVSIVTSESRKDSLEESQLALYRVTDSKDQTLTKLKSADYILKINVEESRAESGGYRIRMTLRNASIAEIIQDLQAFCEKILCISQKIQKFTETYSL